MTETPQPFWVKCRACGHCWAAAYLPMDVMTFGGLAKKAACPKCGADKPLVAKQNSGVLQEPDETKEAAS